MHICTPALIGSELSTNKNNKEVFFERIRSPKANIAENVATSLSSLLGFFLAVWLEESLPTIL